VPEGGALVDVTCRCIHGRMLLRPGPALNPIIIGALARSKRLHGVRIIAFAFLSGHLHLMIEVDDALQLSRFMCHFLSKLAREVGRLTDWREKIFGRRYQAIVISTEKAAQIERLRYILANGTKEGLVERPQDWPGVHAVRALLGEEILEGVWNDRTQEYAARRLRRQKADPSRYESPEVLTLDPLPCWKHLSEEARRSRIASMVAAIQAEAAARRERTGIAPLGPEAILRQDPFSQPVRLKKSPAPRFHAASRKMRRYLYRLYSKFVEQFRDAAEKLRAGDRSARFPPGSFPPGLPFVGG
jgi:REP element-mobilizing transposase RayT